VADRDDTDARAILREHGYDPPIRGRLSQKWWTIVDEIRSGAEPGTPEPDQPADYDAGITEADFPPDDPPPAEQKPRRTRTSAKRPSLSDRLKSRAKTGGKGKRKGPRIPVDRLCEGMWGMLARLAMPVNPPLARCLNMEAPVAGLVLEDIVKGTVVDRVLQPVARAEEKGRKTLALIGPPVIVAALEHAQTLPDQQRQMREAVLVPMLRESMVLWVEVAGDKVEEKARRDQELGPTYERVDELLAMIFAPPTVPSGTSEDGQAATVQAEAMAGAGL